MKEFILAFGLLAFLTTNVDGQNFWKRAIKGEGPIVEKQVSLSTFEGIRSGFSCDIFITQGDRQEVRLEGQQNILENLTLDVDGGILKIKYDRMVRMAKPVKIYITMKNLVQASLSGSGSLVTTNHFRNLENLDVSVSGSGDVRLEVDARDVGMSVSGSGDISLSGTARDLDMSISGSGGIDSRDLMAESCEISISGSGDATVYVKEVLDARVSGSGNIRYRGDVAKVHSRVSGSGSVKSLH